MDFAGGTVVHINAGVAGFVVAMMLGRRKDYSKVAIKPFSPVFAVLGAVAGLVAITPASGSAGVTCAIIIGLRGSLEF